jgi:hypothetical protein
VTLQWGKKLTIVRRLSYHFLTRIPSPQQISPQLDDIKEK